MADWKVDNGSRWMVLGNVKVGVDTDTAVVQLGMSVFEETLYVFEAVADDKGICLTVIEVEGCDGPEVAIMGLSDENREEIRALIAQGREHHLSYNDPDDSSNAMRDAMIALRTVKSYEELVG